MEDFGKSSIQNQQFVRGSVRFFTPVLLETLLKQDEDPESEDWNAQKAAATCLRLVASLVRDEIVQWVMPFVMENINNRQSWRPREAAVLAFGCILDGPSSEALTNIINQAMTVLLKHMGDQCKKGKKKKRRERETTLYFFLSYCLCVCCAVCLFVCFVFFSLSNLFLLFQKLNWFGTLLHGPLAQSASFILNLPRSMFST